MGIKKRNNKGFTSGLAWSGGVIVAVVIGLVVLATPFLGIAGCMGVGVVLDQVEREAQAERQREEHVRKMKEASLAAERERQEREAKAERERQEQQAQAERQRIELAAQARLQKERMEREQQQAEEETIRRRLELARAKAEAEKQQAETQRRRLAEMAEERRLKQERLDREEQREKELRKPYAISTDDLFVSSRGMVGRAVILQGPATFKAFSGGNGTIHFNVRGRPSITVQLPKVESRWKLEPGNVNVRIQGVVGKSMSGVLYLNDGFIVE